MKNFTYIYLFILVALLSFQSGAQEEPDALKAKEHTTVNDFSDYNTFIAMSPHFTLRSIKKKAAKAEEPLRYEGNGVSFSLEAKKYIKTLRRLANRHRTFEGFTEDLNKRFPKLKNAFEQDDSLEDVYRNVRTKTLNGYVDSLPSML